MTTLRCECPERCGPSRWLLLDYRSDLVPVDPFGDGRAAVADQAGDDLDGHFGVREQGHEAVPQLTGCPVLRVEPGCLQDAPEPA